MTEEQKDLLKINSAVGTDFLHSEPNLNYVVKSPGLPVRFADGVVINMNRATRRKNKLYGSHVKRVRLPK